MQHIIPVILGFLIELAVGVPNFLVHPVCLIGNLIDFFEKTLRNFFKETPKGELTAGLILSILVLFFSTTVPLCLILLSRLCSPTFSIFIESILCYFVLATRSLKNESMKVFIPLQQGDIIAARVSLSMIVGRDTSALSPAQIARATVETIAENTTDGIIAPLFFLLIGGAPLGFFYKAANTMDSMLGYKNKRYIYFGRSAAYIDDFLNFIPARIGAIIMITGAFLLKLDYRNAFKVFMRDRSNHLSPNSAQTESVCAGALGIRLGGPSVYNGVEVIKQYIGDECNEVTSQHIKKAIALMEVTAWLFLCLGCSARLIF